MNTMYMNPAVELEEFFVPTARTKGEISKARIKNSNLPFLQFMYHGSFKTPLRCLLTGEPGWAVVPEFGTGIIKKRFRLDYNHIRQQCTTARQAGISVDKSSVDPSSMIRSRYLDPNYRGPNYSYVWRQKERELDVLELMTIMPITMERHSYITQDSAKLDLVLTDFPRESWAWCLQSKENFNKAKEVLNIVHYKKVTYKWMINHLSSIKHENIRKRLTT